MEHYTLQVAGLSCPSCERILSSELAITKTALALTRLKRAATETSEWDMYV